MHMTDLIFFHCNQRGHKKTNSPRLTTATTAAPAAAPTPATMRVTDGQKAKVEAPVVRSRTFQLTAEEARAAPDVVTGMVSSLISL